MEFFGPLVLVRVLFLRGWWLVLSVVWLCVVCCAFFGALHCFALLALSKVPPGIVRGIQYKVGTGWSRETAIVGP